MYLYSAIKPPHQLLPALWSCLHYFHFDSLPEQERWAPLSLLHSVHPPQAGFVYVAKCYTVWAPLSYSLSLAASENYYVSRQLHFWGWIMETDREEPSEVIVIVTTRFSTQGKQNAVQLMSHCYRCTCWGNETSPGEISAPGGETTCACSRPGLFN